MAFDATDTLHAQETTGAPHVDWGVRLDEPPPAYVHGPLGMTTLNTAAADALPPAVIAAQDEASLRDPEHFLTKGDVATLDSTVTDAYREIVRDRSVNPDLHTTVGDLFDHLDPAFENDSLIDVPEWQAGLQSRLGPVARLFTAEGFDEDLLKAFLH